LRSNLFGQRVTHRGEILGCDVCPLDKSPGIRKVKGLVRISKQKAMLWAQCPGDHENAKGLELVGPAGDLLWRTLRPFGLARPDFDVQNVVRCRPTDAAGRNRDPEPRELQCCSVFNDDALKLNAGNARVHVILGDIAATQLLGKGYKKDAPVQWYEPWDSYVVLNWHPSYILRQGGENAGWDYLTWRDRFRAVRAIIDYPRRWGYVKSRGYKAVRTLAEFDEMEKALRLEQSRKRRVSFDIEDGVVDGQPVMLIAGFGTGHYEDPKDWKSWKGQSYCVVLDHPQAGYEPAHLEELKRRTRKLVEDESLKKSLQNGSYDGVQCQQLLGAKRLAGYDYDTQYGTFIRFSFLRSCGLEPLTYRFFPEFADYKDTVMEWSGNFANAPIDRLVLRNGGDCEITQMLEQRFSPQIKQPLVKVYVHAGMTLDKMENRGPILDWENWKKAKAVVPDMIKRIDSMLLDICGNPNFRCSSDIDVAWLIYDYLKLAKPDENGKRPTGKEILENLMESTGNQVLELIMKRRALGVLDSTSLNGYANSARLHSDELRTIWWLTGAITGRLRSGKGRDSVEEGIINFQNFGKNPLLQNLLVSDRNWREAMKE